MNGFGDMSFLNGLEEKAAVTKSTAAPSESIEELAQKMPAIVYKGKQIGLSQSMLKAWNERECNRSFAVQFLDGVWGESSAAQTEGKRFESLVLGATVTGEIEPPILTKAGKETTAEQRIQKNAAFAWIEMRVAYPKGWQAQKLIEIYNLKGTIDALATDEIIDLKYSGLFCPTSSCSNKWNKYTWYWDELDTGHQYHISNNQTHQIQAKHYVLLVYLTTGENLPFSFWVFDSRVNNEGNYKQFQFKISEDTLKMHCLDLIEAAEEISTAIEDGSIDTTFPIFLRCQKCVHFESCKDAAKKPEKLTLKI